MTWNTNGHVGLIIALDRPNEITGKTSKVSSGDTVNLKCAQAYLLLNLKKKSSLLEMFNERREVDFAKSLYWFELAYML